MSTAVQTAAPLPSRAPENCSEAGSLLWLPENEQAAMLESLTEQQANDLLWDWRFWARPNQIAPEGTWRTWLVMAGRGFGKTRAGAEWVRECAEAGRYRRIALVARTSKDVRDVMVEGESGILAISRPGFEPEWEPSKRRLTWPNGVEAFAYTAEKPDELRGPQHEAAWADEVASWKYPETWDMLMFGLRLGDNPRAMVTTTPRPVRVVKDLLANPSTHVTRGSTYENRQNLAPQWFADILTKYEGTRLGRQELMAEVLEDTPGALFTLSAIEKLRVKEAPTLLRIVVGVDPAVSDAEGSGETGIVAAGLGADGHGYVLADASLRGSPNEWATAAVDLLRKLEGDRIVAEVNQGGDMVESTIRTISQNVPYKAVRASRGKAARAEPVAALYEQGRVHHLGGAMAALEDQMCSWAPTTGGKSPDRMDALVWALTALMLDGPQPIRSLPTLMLSPGGSRWRGH